MFVNFAAFSVQRNNKIILLKVIWLQCTKVFYSHQNSHLRQQTIMGKDVIYRYRHSQDAIINNNKLPNSFMLFFV